MKLILIALAACVVALGGSFNYRVQLTPEDGGQIIEIDREQYVVGVVAGESGIFKSTEALKAMAITARTFAASTRGRHASQGFDFCSNTHCQRFLPSNHDTRAVNAANGTRGKLLHWQNQPALASYSQDCGGLSEADARAPYLRVHSDPYCARSGSHQWSWDPTRGELAATLAKSGVNVPTPLTGLHIQRRTPGNRASLLELEGPRVTIPIEAETFRLAIGRTLGWNLLRSDYYIVQPQPGRIHFSGRGRGHGIGLCQFGADEMGREGQSYRQILAFYFPGTILEPPSSSSMSWIRLGGEGVAVFTTRPLQDAKVLLPAERMLPAIKARLSLSNLPEIWLYIYPDMESFRNTTGEPGWVAAHTQGSRIDMQPVAILESRGALTLTLHHELLHVAIDSHSAQGTPAWFNEGLVEYLDHQTPLPAAGDPDESRDLDIRQKRAEPAARRAYANAERRVENLVGRYGEAAAFSWLRSGLPADVKNSSASSALTNSK